MQRAEYESGESRRVEFGTASSFGTAVECNRVAERADRGVQRAHRNPGRAELSAGGPTETDQRRGHADRADVPADPGRPASLRQEPRCGLLSGTAAGTAKLGPERAANAYQQGRRPLPAHAAGARSAAHFRTIRDGL